MNLHVQTKVAKTDITRCLSVLALCPGLEVDEQLKLSTLEGETELNEIVSALLEMNEDDEGDIEKIADGLCAADQAALAGSNG
jgi:hypothetical protein